MADQVSRISETVSKNRRGRPSVFERDGMSKAAVDFVTGGSVGDRQTTNMHYVLEGWCIAKAKLGENVREKYTRRTTGGGLKNTVVFEQIGRMLLQNGYPVEDCEYIAERAFSYLDEGYRAKDVAQWIRTVRNSGEVWE